MKLFYKGDQNHIVHQSRPPYNKNLLAAIHNCSSPVCTTYIIFYRKERYKMSRSKNFIQDWDVYYNACKEFRNLEVIQNIIITNFLILQSPQECVTSLKCDSNATAVASLFYISLISSECIIYLSFLRSDKFFPFIHLSPILMNIGLLLFFFPVTNPIFCFTSFFLAIASGFHFGFFFSSLRLLI